MFLCVWAETLPISGRCDGSHSHVTVEGSYTKKSATYVDGLADALAEVMATGISRLLDFEAEASSVQVDGLENQLINELCLSSTRDMKSVWTFKVSAHINVLELSAVVRLMGRLVRDGKALRVVVLVDSNVVRCACAKGISYSKALSKLLVRRAALSIVGGIYVSFGYVPTRLICADDPTRDTCIRKPFPGMDLATWDRLDLFRLFSLPKLKRWSSNWVRLVFCLLGPSCLHFADRSVFRCPPFPFGLHCASPPDCADGRRGASPHECTYGPGFLDFDAALGFPGKGPLCLWWRACVWRLLVLACVGVSHGVLFPRNAGDMQRILQREHSTTTARRETFLRSYKQTESFFSDKIWRLATFAGAFPRLASGRSLWSCG